MANHPNLRLQQSLDVPGIARLIAQRPVQEEQIRASQQQRRQQKFSSLLETVRLGASLAEQASLSAQRRQAMTRKAEFNSIVEQLAGRTEFAAPEGQQFPGALTPPQIEQQRTQADLIRLQQPTALKAVAQQAFPEATLGTKGGVAQKVNILFPDGGVELGFFDPSTKKLMRFSGEEAPAGSRQAFSEGSRIKFFTDAVTQQRVKTDIVTNVSTVLEAPKGKKGFRGIEELALKEEEQVDKQVERYTKDAVRAASELSLSQINNLEVVLKTDIGAATEPLKSLIARIIAGEKGVLTDRDIARNSGNQALTARVTQLARKWQDGKFSEQNRQEFSRLIDAIKNNSTKKLKRRINVFKNAIGKRFNLAPDEVENVLLLPIIEFEVDPKFTAGGQGSQATSPITKGQTINLPGGITVRRTN